jgi:hypothetical protein
MGAESSLHFRHVRSPRPATWIVLAALLVSLALLASAGLVGLTNPGHSPANEPTLMAPFRWPAEQMLA